MPQQDSSTAPRYPSSPEQPSCRRWLIQHRLVTTVVSLVLMLLVNVKVIASIELLDSLQSLQALGPHTHIDTRRSEHCQDNTIDGALCLHPSDIFYPNGVPASFRDINWLVGTLGLRATDTVVIFGDIDEDNYVIASIVYLLGQKQIFIWKSGAQALIRSSAQGYGRRRGVLRDTYYQGRMRDRHIFLDDDVRRLFKTQDKYDIERLDATSGEVPAQNVATSTGERLVLADTPQQALEAFALAIMGSTNPQMPTKLSPARSNVESSNVYVHIDGLRGRTLRDLGAENPRDTVQWNSSRYLATLVFVLALTGMIVIRWKSRR